MNRWHNRVGTVCVGPLAKAMWTVLSTRSLLVTVCLCLGRQDHFHPCSCSQSPTHIISIFTLTPTGLCTEPVGLHFLFRVKYVCCTVVYLLNYCELLSLCQCFPLLSSPLQPSSRCLSSILGKSNLQFAGMTISLTVSTSSLNLLAADCKQVRLEPTPLLA